MYRQPQRIEYLDSMRGLAALAVLLGHSLIFQWPKVVDRAVNWPVLNMAFDGRAAVAMFFVLSGFVLTRPYFVTMAGLPPRKIFLPSFYLRRLTRIWLPWLAAFGLSAMAQITIFRPCPTVPPTNDWYGWFWQTPLTWGNFFRQCIYNLHAAGTLLLPQDWSLGVELKASAMLPVFIFLAHKLTPWSLFGVAALLVALLPTGHYYASFILGVLLAQQGDNILRWLQPKPFSIKLGLLLAGLALYETNHVGTVVLGHPEMVKYFWLGTSLGCALILLASMSSRRIQAALKWSPVMFLGRISYSVYLLQFIVILCLLPWLIHALNALGIQRTLCLLPLSLAGSISMTVVLSALNYRWVEMPCIDLGHRLSKKIQGIFRKE